MSPQRRSHLRLWHFGVMVIGLALFSGVLAWHQPSAHRYVEGPSQVTVSTLPGLETSQGPSPTPKVINTNPVSQNTTIYYKATEIPEYWGVRAVLAAWSVAKYEDLKLVAECPEGNVPCVDIVLDPKINKLDAAETDFYASYMSIRLNPAIRTPFEAQSTICHEVGHTLGLPHIKGTANSCMPAMGDYIRRPSKLDLSLVNARGPWSFDEAYNGTLKDIDVRDLPK